MYCTVLCRIVLCRIVLCRIVLCCVVLYCTNSIEKSMCAVYTCEVLIILNAKCDAAQSKVDTADATFLHNF